MIDNTSMEICFINAEKARLHLKNEGFIFMGAPDRWKMISNHQVRYALISRAKIGYVINFYHN
jgi:hypothetical protein